MDSMAASMSSSLSKMFDAHLPSTLFEMSTAHVVSTTSTMCAVHSTTLVMLTSSEKSATSMICFMSASFVVSVTVTPETFEGIGLKVQTKGHEDVVAVDETKKESAATANVENPLAKNIDQINLQAYENEMVVDALRGKSHGVQNYACVGGSEDSKWIWKTQLGCRMKKCEEGVLGFFFESEEDCEMIMNRRPWLVNGVLLNLKPWPIEGEARLSDFEVARFWVEIHGLPTRCLSEINAPIVAKKIGHFIKTDGKRKEEIVRRGFLRCWINVWIIHPFPAGFFLKAGANPESWVQFKYEKLPYLCFNCGKLAHLNRECLSPTTWVTPAVGTAVRMYGPWIKMDGAHGNCFTSKGTQREITTGTKEDFAKNGSSSRGLWRRRNHDRKVNAREGDGGGLAGKAGKGKDIVQEGTMHGVHENGTEGTDGRGKIPLGKDDVVQGSLPTSEDHQFLNIPPRNVLHVLPSPDFAFPIGLNLEGEQIPDIGPTLTQSLDIPSHLDLKRKAHVWYSPNPDVFQTPLFKGNSSSDVSLACPEAIDAGGSEAENFGNLEFWAGSCEVGESSHVWSEKKKKDGRRTSNRGSGPRLHMPKILGMARRRPDSCPHLRHEVPCLELPRSAETGGSLRRLAAERAIRGLAQRERVDMVFLAETKVDSMAMAEFWEWITGIILACEGPWLVIGDLNAILNANETRGGREFTAHEGDYLGNFVNDCGGIDLGCIGSTFTWYNAREARARVRKRLDRAIASPNWCVLFPSARVNHHPILSYDHAPLLLDTRPNEAGLKYPFRFMEGAPINAENCAKEASIQLEILVLEFKVERIWKQKSRELWVAKGDSNTKFFHTATIVRRRRNHIGAIKVTPQNRITNREEICRYFEDNFKGLFTTSVPSFGREFESLFNAEVTDSENLEVGRVPTRMEIKNAVWSLHPLKSPRPDGFSGVFYRTYWNIVGGDICDMVQDFFVSGRFVKELNHTFICLIPKCDNPSSFDQFCPLSLCNFGYKVIARILTDRLKPIFDKIISPFQSAFLKGRWIAECSVLATEVMDTMRKIKGRKGFMGVKTDMHKAYDRIEWGFLAEVLKANGFNTHVCNLIMQCVTSVSFSVLVNGAPGNVFSPGRGLRQGDPLSPYLFILCSEVLLKLIWKTEDRGELTGIRIGRNTIPITHLFYADDALLFCRANQREALALSRCLEKYEYWSGQKVSKDKSGIVFSPKISVSNRRDLTSTMGTHVLKGREKYLGNPFFVSARKREDFNFIKTKVLNRLEGWKAKCLSQAGRLTLIKSVLQNIPCYTMSAIRLPVSLCKESDSIVARFWWKGYMNVALVAKLAWNILVQSDRPWVKALSAKYCSTFEFWEVRQSFTYGTTHAFSAVSDLFMSNSRVWDENLIRQCFTSEVANAILRIRPLSDEGDRVFWKASNKGNFSVKNAYWLSQNNRFHPERESWRSLWKLKIHPRQKLLIWKILSNYLPLKSNLGFMQNLDKDCYLSIVKWNRNFTYLVPVVLQEPDPDSAFKRITLRWQEFSRLVGLESDPEPEHLSATQVLLAFQTVLSVLEAEFEAILLCLELCADLGLEEVRIHSDSSTAAKALQAQSLPYAWGSYPSFAKCLSWLNSFKQWEAAPLVAAI
uniref:Reverse transcriptase n=1 Tax=Cannabis sativa TaxID=3483 RepID=A0A803Q247_CANSA